MQGLVCSGGPCLADHHQMYFSRICPCSWVRHTQAMFVWRHGSFTTIRPMYTDGQVVQRIVYHISLAFCKVVAGSLEQTSSCLREREGERVQLENNPRISWRQDTFQKASHIQNHWSLWHTWNNMKTCTIHYNFWFTLLPCAGIKHIPLHTLWQWRLIMVLIKLDQFIFHLLAWW